MVLCGVSPFRPAALRWAFDVANLFPPTVFTSPDVRAAIRIRSVLRGAPVVDQRMDPGGAASATCMQLSGNDSTCYAALPVTQFVP